MSAVATSSEGLTEAGTSNVLLTWLASWRWLAVGQGSEFPEHMGLSLHRAACVSSQCGEHDRGLSELPKRPKWNLPCYSLSGKAGALEIMHFCCILLATPGQPWFTGGGDKGSNTRWGSLGAGLTHCALFLDPQLRQAVLSHFNSLYVEQIGVVPRFTFSRVLRMLFIISQAIIPPLS